MGNTNTKEKIITVDESAFRILRQGPVRRVEWVCARGHWERDGEGARQGLMMTHMGVGGIVEYSSKMMSAFTWVLSPLSNALESNICSECDSVHFYSMCDALLIAASWGWATVCIAPRLNRGISWKWQIKCSRLSRHGLSCMCPSLPYHTTAT